MIVVFKCIHGLSPSMFNNKFTSLSYQKNTRGNGLNLSITEENQSNSAKICPTNISQVKANPCTNSLTLRIFQKITRRILASACVHSVQDGNFKLFNAQVNFNVHQPINVSY